VESLADEIHDQAVVGVTAELWKATLISPATSPFEGFSLLGENPSNVQFFKIWSDYLHQLIVPLHDCQLNAVRLRCKLGKIGRLKGFPPEGKTLQMAKLPAGFLGKEGLVRSVEKGRILTFTFFCSTIATVNIYHQ
jgi:hypothetical protein